MYSLLLVEDDTKITEVLTDYISEKAKGKLTMQSAFTGDACYKALEEGSFDLILLDVMLPDTDGFSILRRIRENSNIPVIFITARGALEDVLYGYSIGCDDYVVKPFLMAELLAKIYAVLRRTADNSGGEKVRLGAIELDRRRYTVTSGGKIVTLQNKQYMLLRFLMENPGMVWSRNELLDRIWGYDYVGIDRVVDNQIKKLRKSLGASGRQIKTVVGQGYKIEEE